MKSGTFLEQSHFVKIDSASRVFDAAERQYVDLIKQAIDFVTGNHNHRSTACLLRSCDGVKVGLINGPLVNCHHSSIPPCPEI